MVSGEKADQIFNGSVFIYRLESVSCFTFSLMFYVYLLFLVPKDRSVFLNSSWFIVGIGSNEINHKCSKEVYLIVSGVKFQIYAAFREMSGNLFMVYLDKCFL